MDRAELEVFQAWGWGPTDKYQLYDVIQKRVSTSDLECQPRCLDFEAKRRLRKSKYRCGPTRRLLQTNQLKKPGKKMMLK